MQNKRTGLFRWILIGIIAFAIFSTYLDIQNAPLQTEYSTLITNVKKGGVVTELYVEGTTATATMADGVKYACEIPSVEVLQADIGEEIISQSQEGKLKYKIAPESTSWLDYLMPITSVLMLVLFFFQFYLFLHFS